MKTLPYDWKVEYAWSDFHQGKARCLKVRVVSSNKKNTKCTDVIIRHIMS